MFTTFDNLVLMYLLNTLEVCALWEGLGTQSRLGILLSRGYHHLLWGEDRVVEGELRPGNSL